MTHELLLCHADSGKIPLLEWMAGLDAAVRARVRVRIDRLEDGNFGDVKTVGAGVSELRLDFGAGYRIYFARRRREVHLLGGGSKSSQVSDIEAAKRLWRQHEN